MATTRCSCTLACNCLPIIRALVLQELYKNMKFSILLLTSLLSFNSMAYDYQTEIDEFFELYQIGRINEAVDSIYKSNEYVSSIPDQIIKVKNQLTSLKGLMGNVNNIGKLDTYTVGEYFVHITYIVTYDRQPLRYEFQFFKVKEGWRIYSFSFDDKITNEIKELARKSAMSPKK
ncbi:hypothetical protein SHVI106290_04180 [Shewanella violacea]|uniref:Uncharacterized protein n=2 Tax=Shewanella violacea TaxID=60217 RepID=D4ZAK2_SHEVD|nr:hypothetical protein SVI_3076 [Shewanella violacea DSS12]